MTKQTKIARVGWTAAKVLWIGVLLAMPSTGLCGVLEPPVPPGTPTMKPMNELEPRRPIYAEMLPLRITEPGSSWYFAENINTSGNGITVAADDVTIDLMGFTLQGGTGIGIRDDQSITPSPEGVTVRNGTVRGWLDHGIRLGTRSTVIQVRAAGNSGNGIQVGYASIVADSIVTRNGIHGIHAGAVAEVRDCVAFDNAQNGIYGWDHALIKHCTVNNNDRNGIRVDDACYVLENTVHANSLIGGNDFAGIWVAGNYNRVEGNLVTFNQYGVRINGDQNVVVRNSAQQNFTKNYDIDPAATNNLIGTIQTSLASSGPWDNLCIGTCP